MPEGLRVTTRKSKGDQEGEGQEIAIVRGRKACPVKAMTTWLEAAGITGGPVFRRMRRRGVVLPEPLRPQGIAEVVKHYAAKGRAMTRMPSRGTACARAFSRALPHAALPCSS